MGKRGQCYLIAEARTGRYKIGKAKYPTARRTQLQTGNSKRLGIICTIPTVDMDALENWLKEKYKHKKIRGEWFLLSFDDVVEIRSMPGAW